MSKRWDLCSFDEARHLLDQAEHIGDLDPIESDAFNFLIDAVDQNLWNRNESHEALRLWCMCCKVLERVVELKVAAETSQVSGA